MFRGSYQHTMDAKGRLSIPSRFRDVLAQRYEEGLILTGDVEDPCLVIYPLEAWKIHEEKLMGASATHPKVKQYQRLLYYRMVECELDRQGRILIPPMLREYAQLNKEVLVVGVGDKIEIWDKKLWEQRVACGDLKELGSTLAGMGL